MPVDGSHDSNLYLLARIELLERYDEPVALVMCITVHVNPLPDDMIKGNAAFIHKVDSPQPETVLDSFVEKVPSPGLPLQLQFII